MDEMLGVFIQEAKEQLAAMEAGLLQLEQGDQDPETLNAIFRAAHTIKGASGVVEIGAIEAFTHVLENLLDKLRNGEIAVSGELITHLLKGGDHINALLAGVEQGCMEPPAPLIAAGEALATQLRELAGDAPKAPPEQRGVARQAHAEVERGGETAITDS